MRRRSVSQRLRSANLALVILGLFATSAAAQPAQVCFSQAGTFGGLTVTQSGAGCGNFLTYGGITNGLYMGDNATESCTFNVSPSVQGSTLLVRLTAHSCIPGSCEEVQFSLNGTHYAVAPADLDNTQPPGGTSVSINGAGDVVGSPVSNGDGRATVTFNSAPASVTSILINHVITSGSPAGTIYEVCAFAGGNPPPPPGPALTPAPVPTLSEWMLMLVAGLVALGGIALGRRRFR